MWHSDSYVKSPAALPLRSCHELTLCSQDSLTCPAFAPSHLGFLFLLSSLNTILPFMTYKAIVERMLIAVFLLERSKISLKKLGCRKELFVNPSVWLIYLSDLRKLCIFTQVSGPPVPVQACYRWDSKTARLNPTKCKSWTILKWDSFKDTTFTRILLWKKVILYNKVVFVNINKCIS